jgi:hypothetical protein
MTLSLLGANFGSDLAVNRTTMNASTITASVADSRCNSTVYASATLVTCAIASRQVAELARAASGFYASLTVRNLVGTLQQLSLAYELDQPKITAVAPTNSPMSGGVSITLGGMSFGFAGSQSTAYLGSTACTATGWISETAMVCTLGFGTIAWRTSAGGREDVRIFADKRGAAANSAFTYDAPLLTFAAPQNGVCSGGTSVTLSGTNFGVAAVRSGLSVAWGSGSRSSRWISNTALVVGVPSLYTDFFGLPDKQKAQNALTVTLPDLATHAIVQFRYDSAAVTAVFPWNSPASGGTVVTISGMNYATEAADLVVDICAVGADVEWLSPNAVTCRVQAGIAAGVVITATSASLRSASGGIFSYDLPVITGLVPLNSPTSGGPVLTVLGFNFGIANSSPLALIGVSACSSTLWLSDSAIACTVVEGSCAGQLASATVSPAGVRRLPMSSSLLSFGFDPPMVTSSTVFNAPSTVRLVTMNLGGINFGVEDRRQSGKFGAATCDDFSWLSDTAVMCRMQSNELRSAGTVSTLVSSSCSKGSPAPVFTFDAPLVTHVSPCNTAAVSARVDLLGLNFGAYANNALGASVGPTACRAVQWASATALQCTTAPATTSARVDQQVAVSVGKLASSQRVFITFDAPMGPPVISAVSPVNAPISLSPVPLLISGSLFGSEAGRAEVLVGQYSCIASQWISDTALSCVTRRVNGALGTTSDAADVTVTRGGIATLVQWSFTVDAPVVTLFVPSNTAATAGASITLSGINFGSKFMGLAVAVGHVQAATVSAWISETSVTMRAPPAASSRPALITTMLSSSNLGAAALVHTSAAAFAYNAPVVTAVASGAIAERIVATISGTNFGVADWTPTVRIGSVSILGAGWLSDTSLVVTAGSNLPLSALVRVGVGGGGGPSGAGAASSSVLADFAGAVAPLNPPQYVCSAWSGCNSSCDSLLTSEGAVVHKMRTCACVDPRDPNGSAVARGNSSACVTAGIAAAPLVSECTDAELRCAPVVYRIHPSRSVVGDVVSIIGRALGRSAADVLSVRLGITECYTSAWVSSSIIRCQVPIANGLAEMFRLDLLATNATLYADESFAKHIDSPPPLLRITTAADGCDGGTPPRPDSAGVYYEERVDFPQMSEAFAFMPQVRTYLRTPRREAMDVTCVPPRRSRPRHQRAQQALLSRALMRAGTCHLLAPAPPRGRRSPCRTRRRTATRRGSTRAAAAPERGGSRRCSGAWWASRRRRRCSPSARCATLAAAGRTGWRGSTRCVGVCVCARARSCVWALCVRACVARVRACVCSTCVPHAPCSLCTAQMCVYQLCQQSTIQSQMQRARAHAFVRRARTH